MITTLKGSVQKDQTLLFMEDLKFYENSEKEAERLTDTVRIFLNNIAMEFGITKCTCHNESRKTC